jgi:hypothetical protein
VYTCTIQEYQTLCSAINTGALTVRYADKTVTYRSIPEMKHVLMMMENYLFPSQIPPKNRIVIVSKGVYDDRFMNRNRGISRFDEFTNDLTDHESDR